MAQLPPGTRVPEFGSLVGPWLVQERVGSGSNGVVLRALHTGKLGAGNYAFKLAKEPKDERFEREAKMLVRIHHPSVPRYAGSGFWTSPRGDVYPYVVMQWVEGVPLYEWVALHGLTLRQALTLLAQVARALEATHEHGVHRDIKGDNVLVSAMGHAVLVDYGCCWYPEARQLTDAPIPPGTENYRSLQLRRFRDLNGHDPTASYQFQPSDDVYALGVTAYRLVAGKYPPQSTESWDQPPELTAPRGLAERCPEFSELILSMLSDEPAARGKAGELAEAMERLAKQARPELDLPWVERSSLQPTQKAKRPGPTRWHEFKALAPRFAFPVSIAALVLLVLLLPRGVHQSEETSEERTDGSRAPDAGTVGMGNTALASSPVASAVPLLRRGISRDMPKRPFKGQKRPPCDKRDEAEINGGCWTPQNGLEAPCEAKWYEYQRRCYKPLLDPEREPTSEEP